MGQAGTDEVHGVQNVAAWEEAQYEGGPAPAPRKGAAMASTAGRFAVMFGGKAVAEDGTETCLDDTLLMEALGGSILRIHALAVGPTKPAPRAGAMFQVLLVHTSAHAVCLVNEWQYRQVLVVLRLSADR